MTRERATARRGFTLLEVLVAVALLGVVVSVLARSAIQGMSYEGDAARRTRASLLADRTLFRVEAALSSDLRQPVHQESEEGEFQVLLDVQPLELGPAASTPWSLRARRGRASAGAAGEAPRRPRCCSRCFSGPRPGELDRGTARAIGDPQHFAYDASAAAQILGAEAAAEARRPRAPRTSRSARRRRRAEEAVRRRAAEAAFTLLEMLFVVLVSSIVLTFAANFYIDLSYASSAALEASASSCGAPRARSTASRVTSGARCWSRSREALDPLEHPWLFLAEGSGQRRRRRLRFQARNHRPRPGAGHESDLVEIAYWLVPSEAKPGSFDLLRWTSARPPLPPLDRNFPRRDDPGVELLVSGVALFTGAPRQDADRHLAERLGFLVSRAVERICRSLPKYASRSSPKPRGDEEALPLAEPRCSCDRSCSRSTPSTSRRRSASRRKRVRRTRKGISPASR